MELARTKQFLSMNDIDYHQFKYLMQFTHIVWLNKHIPLLFSAIMKGKKVGMFFEKPSCRTIVSFWTGGQT